MKKLAVVAVVLIVATAMYLLDRKPERALRVSGFVEADEIRIGSRVGGRVARVAAREGQLVRAGEVLVELEPFDLAEARARAEAEVARRRAQMAELRAGYRSELIAAARAQRDAANARLQRLIAGPRPEEIDAAEAALRRAIAQEQLARLEYERIRKLVEAAATSPQELDRVRAAVDAASADVVARRAQLTLLRKGTRQEEIAEARALLAAAEHEVARLTNGPRKEEIDAATAAVAAAEAELRSIERRLEELVVRVPSDGAVEAMELDPGDLVHRDAPIATIMDASSRYVRVYVPENRLDFDLGERVVVQVDAYPGRSFAGRVSFISQQAEFVPRNVQTPEERSQQVFRVKVTLEDGAALLRPGMSADVLFGESGP